MKKRDKQRVRILAVGELLSSGERVVKFRFYVNDLPYEGHALVPPGKDVWDVIAEDLDSEDVALLQQEREV